MDNHLANFPAISLASGEHQVRLVSHTGAPNSVKKIRWAGIKLGLMTETNSL